MFFWRKDKKAITRGKRRIASDRAAVFAEFSFLAPFLVLLLSAMIELVSFWDAKVMANHAAWAIGRIAQVRCVEEQKEGSTKLFGMTFGEEYTVLTNKVKSSTLSPVVEGALSGTGAVPLLKTRQDVVSLFMMSTCGMGGYGAYWYDGKGKGSSLKALFTAPLNTLTQFLKDKVSSLAETIAGLGKLLPGMDGLFSAVAEFLKKVLTAVLEKVLAPVINFIQKLINKLVDAVFKPFNRDVAEDDAVWDRMFSRVCAARERMSGTTYKCEVTVDKLTGMASGNHTIWAASENSRMARFTYPQAALQSDKREDGWLKAAQGWPINGQKQSLIKITLDWPFSSGWVFPVVSGFGKIEGDVVTRGTSIVYPQPAIMNEHLLSEGSTAYEKGAVPDEKVDWGALKLGNYVKMASFALQYRMAYEQISPRDTDPSWYHSYTLKVIEPLYTILANNDKNNGDYKNTFYAVTGSSDQNPLMKNFKKHFERNWFYNEYLYWLASSARHRYYTHDAPPGNGNSQHGHYSQEGTRAGMYFRTGTAKYGDGRLIKLAGEYDRAADYAKTNPNTRSPTFNFDAYWPDAPQRYRDLIKPNLYSLIRFYARSDEETRSLMSANNVLSGYGTSAGTSLLRKQACNFSDDMQKYRVQLEKIAKGDNEEIASGMDLLTDEQIRSLQDPQAQFKKIQERWEQIQQQMNGLYNQIDANIPSLASTGKAYHDQLASFISGLDDRFRRLVQEGKRFCEEHPDDESSGAELAAKLRAWVSVGSNGVSFRNAHQKLKEASDNFQTAIANMHKRENDYVSLIGGGTPGGGRKLDPKDIDDGGDPIRPEDTPEGSPKSGNDDFPGGVEWTLESGGWKKVK